MPDTGESENRLSCQTAHAYILVKRAPRAIMILGETHLWILQTVLTDSFPDKATGIATYESVIPFAFNNH